MILFKIIMVSCVLITWFAIYFKLNSAYKPKKNMFMAVTLPSDVLESQFIKDIQKEYKSLCNKVCLIMALTAIPIIFQFWIFKNMTVYIFYLLAWCLFFSYYGASEPFKRMHRKVKAEKYKNQWFIGETKTVYCDTKTNLLKNTMPISNKYYLIPFLLNVLLIVICLRDYTSDNLPFLIISILNFAIIFLLFYTAQNSNSEKLKTYCNNSDVNFILNKASKRMFSIYFLINTIFEVLTLLIVNLIILEYIDIKFMNAVIIGIILLSFIISLGFIYIKKKLSALEEELLANDNSEEIIVDDDDYWIDGIYYCNPNDTNKLVTSRYGYNMTYNIATKHGYFMTKKLDKIVLIATFILIGVLMIPSEILNSKITLNNTSPNINISAFPYSYELNYKNIESINITDEPISFKLRTNGIGLEDKLIGNFRSDKYGRCRVYLYLEDNNEYIVIKLKNGKHDYLIYNNKDKASTQKIYEQISNNIK